MTWGGERTLHCKHCDDKLATGITVQNVFGKQHIGKDSFLGASYSTTLLPGTPPPYGWLHKSEDLICWVQGLIESDRVFMMDLGMWPDHHLLLYGSAPSKIGLSELTWEGELKITTIPNPKHMLGENWFSLFVDSLPNHVLKDTVRAMLAMRLILNYGTSALAMLSSTLGNDI
jgi:hypothetical protein